MITIIHAIDAYGNHWTTAHNPNPENHFNSALYHAGLDAPNYPFLLSHTRFASMLAGIVLRYVRLKALALNVPT